MVGGMSDSLPYHQEPQLLEVALILHKQNFNLLGQCWQYVPLEGGSAWGGPLKEKAS